MDWDTLLAAGVGFVFAQIAQLVGWGLSRKTAALDRKAARRDELRLAELAALERTRSLIFDFAGAAAELGDVNHDGSLGRTLEGLDDYVPIPTPEGLDESTFPLGEYWRLVHDLTVELKLHGDQELTGLLSRLGVAAHDCLVATDATTSIAARSSLTRARIDALVRVATLMRGKMTEDLKLNI